MNKKLNWGFILIGIALLCVGTVYPNLKIMTAVTDITPPEISYEACCPQNGQFYTTMGALICGCRDLESEIKSVTCTVDGTLYTLVYNTVLAWEWQYPLSANSPPNAEGSHSFKFTVTNYVGLSTTYLGSYQIITVLEGNWYINDVLVINPSQTLYFSTLTLTFKFVKTAGIVDNQISCNVVEGARQLLALTYQGSSTWTGTCTFAGGTHTLALKASDGFTSITMSLLNLNFGGALPPAQIIIYVIGGTFIALGGYGQLTRARAIKKRSHLR